MLPNEVARAPMYLYDWSNLSRVPYSDFLRAKQFEHSIRYGIDNQTKQLIASNQQLSERGIEVLSDSLDRGFTTLSEDIGRVTDALREGTAEIVGAVQEGTAEIVSTLNWGFAEVLISLGQMNINLAELVKLTRTPSQTWACELFEIARDEFRRQLYPEALQSVTRAIEGFGSNPGIKTEFRFHFLVGTIRLGSYKNSSSEVVDPQHAEQAFLAAARYAQADYPAEAGQSLICAGRAALVQGAIDNAIVHTRNGLAFVPTHAAGMYQLGRALFLKGEFSEATDRLVDAILLDVEHALHASSDADFLSKMDFLNNVLRQTQDRYQVRYRQTIEQYMRAEEVLRSFSFGGVRANSLGLEGLVHVRDVCESAKIQASTNTLFGYNSAIAKILEGYGFLKSCFAEYKEKFIRHHQNELNQYPQHDQLSMLHSRVGPPPDDFWKDPGAVLAGGFGVGIVSAVVVAFFASFQVAIVLGIFIGALVTFIESARHEGKRSANEFARTSYESALNSFKTWRISLEQEMATIASMSLPKECEFPTACAVKNMTSKASKKITNEVELGSVYKGTVLRLLDFGAIVQVLPGKEGLLHISQISHQRVDNVSDYLKEGQVVRVKVVDIDKTRLQLSMKAVAD